MQRPPTDAACRADFNLSTAAAQQWFHEVPALEKRTLRFTLNQAELLELEYRAREAQMTLQNYVRTQLRLQVRSNERPTTEDLEREEDDAWERLRRIGLNPAKYFLEG